MPILLGFSQRPQGNGTFFEPAGNGIGITPFVLFLPIDFGNLHSTQFFLDVLLIKPITVLVESFVSESLTHDFTT